jgi:hypothetical protein
MAVNPSIPLPTRRSSLNKKASLYIHAISVAPQNDVMKHAPPSRPFLGCYQICAGGAFTTFIKVLIVFEPMERL